MIGKTVSHYKVLEKLGEGGMGVVYKAEDSRLHRTVALKFLPPGLTKDPEARKRFVQEARAASAIDHPNICTIYEIDETEDGQTFIAMAHYEGETLKEKIASGLLGIDLALDIAFQIASGLKEAHEKSIVHRDIKPANIIITSKGQVKIMDFGLAKLRGQTIVTREGTTLGTVSYMSPEQTRGEDVDNRTDIWSLGVVLYEMITVQRPFKGDYDQAVIYSILNDTPLEPSRARKGTSVALSEINMKLLEKSPGDRFRSMEEFQEALIESGIPFRRTGVQSRRTVSLKASLKRPAFLVPAFLFVCILAVLAIFFVRNAGEVNKARNVVLPRILDLAEQEDQFEAYLLSLEVDDLLSDDPLFQDVWEEITDAANVITDPPNTEVYIKSYKKPNSEWLFIGKTPLNDIELPLSFNRFRLEREGYERVELAYRASEDDTLFYTLDKVGIVPEGMIKIPGGSKRSFVSGHGYFYTGEIPDFYLDRYEVTNRDFKTFVNEGGYKRPEFWTHEFVKDGISLSWDEAIKLFKDRTGRAGPSTWELGSYVDSEGDYPVAGVCWYEAEAYAEYAGKKLPSLYHWAYVAAVHQSAEIIPFSNFSKSGLAPVGSYNGIGYYGDYDLAGNAREWCFNTLEGNRFLLGGCWSDPLYMFSFPLTLPVFDRNACNGFRCILEMDDNLARETVWDDISTRSVRDYSTAKPVSDAMFEAYRDLFEYGKTPLDARIEFIDDESEHWTIEKVTFNAAYGGERMFGYLFIPKEGKPPYQTIVLFPGAYALDMRSSGNGRTLNSFGFVDFVIRSGRAVFCPVYKSTYERGDGYSIYDPDNTISDFMGHMLLWYKDLGQSLDYLETREDIDDERIAYFGSSWGGWIAPIFIGLDDRYRVTVLRLCGLPTFELNPPVDPINYVPRITMPVLMVNGKYDYIFPHETSQVPMFEMLGTSPENKRHVIVEAAHSTFGSRNRMIREVLDFLDRHMGLVQ